MRYDVGKKVNSRKRHIVIDMFGLLLLVIVTAGNVQDKPDGKQLRQRLYLPRLQLLWADGGQIGSKSPLVGYGKWSNAMLISRDFMFCHVDGQLNIRLVG